MAQIWIGPDDSLTVGQTGFLIENRHTIDGWTHHRLRDTPAGVVSTRQPVLDGPCGTFNNVSTFAQGVARVVRVAKNARALVTALAGAELAAALDELGYPELLPGATPPAHDEVPEWIHVNSGAAGGDAGFLIRATRPDDPHYCGWSLWQQPGVTLREQHRLHGHLGNELGTVRTAWGMARIVEVRRVGDEHQARIVELSGDDLRAAKTAAGWPHLE